MHRYTMKIVTMTLISLVIAVLCIGTEYALFHKKGPRVAYVKAERLFNEFELTKELKSKYSNIENAKTAILDSLLLGLKASAKFERDERFRQLENAYYHKKEVFENENEELTELYNRQIWSRINQYVADFSKKEGYDLVLGANGTGAIFYGNEGLDITDDVVAYMNMNYAGKK